jgi:hypothetical protein
MSADGNAHVPQADAPDHAADQSQQAASPGDAGRQRSDVPARQPPDTRTRQEYADAALARSPGRAQETPARGALAEHASRQAERPPPERVPGPRPEAGKRAEHGAEGRTRQEYADPMLAGPPGRVHETAARGAPAGQDKWQAEQASSARAPGPGLAPADARGEHGAAPSPGQASQHAGQDHVSGGAQPRTEVQGDLAGMPGAGRAIGGEPHPVSRPGAGHPAGGHAVGETVAHAEDMSTSRQDSGNRQATEQDRGDTWPPPQADRDRARTLYEEDFGAKRAVSDAQPGRDRGTNVVGDKPVKSPGDTSDLPPTGEELLETADEDAPRTEKVHNQFYKSFDDIDDAAKTMVTSAKAFLDQPPPTGHPGVLVDTQPQWEPESAPNATPDAGSFAEIALVSVVLGDRTIDWARHKLAEMRGRG